MRLFVWNRSETERGSEYDGTLAAVERRALVVAPLFTEAVRSQQSGRLAEAVDLYERILLLRPSLPEVHWNCGVALARLGRLGDAEAAHRQAIVLDPDFPDSYVNLGDLLLCFGRVDDAETTLRHAIALNAQFAEAFSNLGNALKEQGRLGEAEAACRQAIALKPDNAQAHCNLGNTLKNQERLIEAEAAFRRAIALNPNLADAPTNLGTTLSHLGRLADARQAAEQAVQLAPLNASYLLNLSHVRYFAAADPYVVAMEQLALNIASLPVTQQIELHFALAKTYVDIDRLFEIFSAGLPRHAIDPGRSIMLECSVALLQEVNGDVMQQRGEPYISTLSRRLAHGYQSVRRGFPAQCPDRGGLAAVSLGRGPSLHDLR